MCVEGLCSSLLRCNINPSSLCDVPDWCPVDASQFGFLPSGAPCTCFYPDNGTVCRSFQGSIELL